MSPEMRDWERFSTTAPDAEARPPMASDLLRLRDGLAASCFACPLPLRGERAARDPGPPPRGGPVAPRVSGPDGTALAALKPD